MGLVSYHLFGLKKQMGLGKVSRDFSKGRLKHREPRRPEMNPGVPGRGSRSTRTHGG